MVEIRESVVLGRPGVEQIVIVNVMRTLNVRLRDRCRVLSKYLCRWFMGQSPGEDVSSKHLLQSVRILWVHFRFLHQKLSKQLCS